MKVIANNKIRVKMIEMSRNLIVMEDLYIIVIYYLEIKNIMIYINKTRFPVNHLVIKEKKVRNIDYKLRKN